jgi:hypothetical protein
MKENLFSVKFPKSFNDDFEIFIHDDPFVMVNPYDAKKEYKRVLVEMADTYSNLILAYSGGMDSAFILCCLRDLIEEGKLTKDTIKIIQGTFTIAGKQLSVDRIRAANFAVDLGFTPEIYNMELDDNVQNEIENWVTTHGFWDYTVALQNIWASKQNGTVIARHGNLNGKTHVEMFGTTNDNPDDVCQTIDFWTSFSPHSNWIDFEKWDAAAYSTLITPYHLNKSKVDLQPFEQVKEDGLLYYSGVSVDAQDEVLSKVQHPLHPARIDNHISRIITFLQCYPEMTRLWGKFVTIDSVLGPHFLGGIEHPLANRLMDFKKGYKKMRMVTVNWTYVKKLDGTLWNIRDSLKEI